MYFSAKSNLRYRILTEIIRACALRIDLMSHDTLGAHPFMNISYVH